EGPLLPFIDASIEERAELMAGALRQKLSIAFKPGIARFEEILQPFGLAAAVPAVIKQILLELASVRNVLVHKNGIADTRFLDACPWLKLVRGTRVVLTPKRFQMYDVAAHWYMLALASRIMN